jgi:LacI family transcriptional regulator, repressor for deo operon, udp, cdd, tsx, nupC, and nupG
MTQSLLTPRPKVTIREVANASGVSIGTVSRALKNQNGLSEETREQVLKTAQSLGYDVGNLRQGKIKRLSFITTRLAELPANPFYGAVLHGVEDACRDEEIVLSYTTLRPQDKALEIIRRHESDALILANYVEPKLLEKIKQLGLPVVLVDHHMDGFASVNMDNIDGAIQAVQHLLELGRKRIAFIDGPPHHSIIQRARGFRQALFLAGVPADPDLEAHYNHFTEPMGVQNALKTLLGLPQPADAVFCWNDETALAVMRHAQDMGVRVPQDLAVVGFDDIELARHARLSTVHVDKEVLGRKAVDILLGNADNHTIVPVKLLVRSSSAESKLASKTSRN